MGLFEAACGIVIFLFLLYRYLIATYNFWKQRDVPGPDPVLIFGTMKDLILKKEFPGTYFKHMYDTYEDAQFVGLFKMRQPVLMIKDPKHIKDIFFKDSSLFCTRGIPFYPNAEPLLLFLFSLDGSVAHDLRAKMSPAFTPSNLKKVFSKMQESFMRFENYMDVLLLKSNCVNCSDVTARLIADIVGSSLMDVDMKTLSIEENDSNKFLNHNEFFRGTEGNQMIRKILSEAIPQLYDLIGYRLFHNDKITNFYTNFILELMEYRKKHNIIKSDFVGLLMELRDHPEKLSEIIDNDHFYGAQIFGFFYAAYETSSTTITNTLYELALNQNIQEKLRDEIQNFCSKNEELTYDNINSIPYLNAVFKETTRKYPIAVEILRKSSSNYTFRDTKLTIPKGQTVLIPIYAIHHNPKIYPKPEVYDPERFSDEAVRSRNPMHHIPFGYGIRNCLGERLGILQTKMTLIALLRKYKIEICEKTITSYKYHLLPIALLPAEPIYLKITKIDLE